jgi:Domain of unknown function (DUF1707)
MCYSRHHHRRTVVRQVQEEEQRRDPELRASDAERESIVAQLREHGAAGRLDVEELEQRVGAAYAARTHGELGALLADLPAKPVAAPRPRQPQRRGHWPGHEWAAFLQVNVLLVAIWAISGAGYFWPAWVMVWWAFALVLKSRPRLLRPR